MWFFLALSYFILSIILHRMIAVLKIFKGVITGFCGAAFLSGMLLIAHSIISFGLSKNLIASIVWYLLFCEFYMFSFTLSLGSVSIKLLKLLSQGPQIESDIEEFYKPTNMVGLRIHRLAIAGLIEQEENGLQLTNRGRLITQIAVLLKTLFHGNKGLPFK